MFNFTDQSPYTLDPKAVQTIKKSGFQQEYPPGAKLIKQGQLVEQIGIIESGRALIIFRSPDGTDVILGTIQPGHLYGVMAFLTGTLSMHSIICQEKVSCIIHDKETLAEAIAQDSALESVLYQHSFDKMRFFFNSLRRHQKKNGDSSSDTEIQGRLENALKYIRNHSTQQLTLESVARQCGMSKFYFSRLFKKNIGCSFKTYLNRVRIENAKDLLSRKNTNITEVCFAVGFNDLSYFSKVFHKMEGKTPSGFKRSWETMG